MNKQQTSNVLGSVLICSALLLILRIAMFFFSCRPIR